MNRVTSVTHRATCPSCGEQKAYVIHLIDKLGHATSLCNYCLYSSGASWKVIQEAAKLILADCRARRAAA